MDEGGQVVRWFSSQEANCPALSRRFWCLRQASARTGKVDTLVAPVYSVEFLDICTFNVLRAD